MFTPMLLKVFQVVGLFYTLFYPYPLLKFSGLFSEAAPHCDETTWDKPRKIRAHSCPSHSSKQVEGC